MRLCHEALHGRSCWLSFLTLTVPCLLSMATDKPLLLSAILESKSAIAIMTLSTDRCVDIEIEGDIEEGKLGLRSQYSVRLYVADKKIAKSASKPASLGLKWEWNADNLMWVLVLWITSWSIFTSWNQLVRAVVDDEGCTLPWIRDRRQAIKSSCGTTWGESRRLTRK